MIPMGLVSNLYLRLTSVSEDGVFAKEVGRSVRVDRIEYDITRKSVVSLANVCDSRTKEFY